MGGRAYKDSYIPRISSYHNLAFLFLSRPHFEIMCYSAGKFFSRQAKCRCLFVCLFVFLFLFFVFYRQQNTKMIYKKLQHNYDIEIQQLHTIIKWISGERFWGVNYRSVGRNLQKTIRSHHGQFPEATILFYNPSQNIWHKVKKYS